MKIIRKRFSAMQNKSKTRAKANISKETRIKKN